MLKEIVSFITHDPIRKVFALVFAFCLWIYVAIGNNYTYEKNIKVVYTNLADSLIIIDSIANIDITFSGRGGALFGIWAAPPRAQCDLKQLKIGKNNFLAKNLRIPVAYGPLKIDFSIPTFTVAIDNKVEKQMTVSVPIKESPKSGYAISDVYSLDTILIVGPKKMLDNITVLTTESLSVRNRSSSFERELRLEISSSLFSPSRQKVRIRVDIDTTTRKVLTNVPLILIYSPNQQVRVDKNNLDTLIVEGSPNRIQGLSTRDIEVRIKLTELSAGYYNLPAEVILPAYIKPTHSVPKTFNITIQ